jgi:hypothetical protein
MSTSALSFEPVVLSEYASMWYAPYGTTIGPTAAPPPFSASAPAPFA